MVEGWSRWKGMWFVSAIKSPFSIKIASNHAISIHQSAKGISFIPNDLTTPSPRCQLTKIIWSLFNFIICVAIHRHFSTENVITMKSSEMATGRRRRKVFFKVFMSSTESTSIVLMMLSLALVFLTWATPTVGQQLAAKLVQNPCVNKRTCHECIQTQSCAWCMQPDHGDKPRCFQHSYSNICPEEYIWNPDTEQKFVLNRELTRAESIGGGFGGQMSYGSSYMSNSSYSSSMKSAYSSSYSASSSSRGYAGASSREIVQISPQRVGLKLRISMYLKKLNNCNISPTFIKYNIF